MQSTVTKFIPDGLGNFIKASSTSPNADFFLLRLDDETPDKIHLKASRAAIIAYAKEIAERSPALAKHLLNEYSVIQNNQNTINR